MTLNLTFWISPFTTLSSLHDAIETARALARMVSTPAYPWHASLLLPVHYGQWSQAQCRQNLPPDMLVGSPAHVAPIRTIVEAKGLGFGVWGVPIDQSSTGIAAAYAAAGGYYAANFEPTASFWQPGDDPTAVDAWWSAFWNVLPDQQALSGNVIATVVPNAWGLGAFTNSLPNLAAGCNGLALECYGGVETANTYLYPSLWPTYSFASVEATGVQAKLIPILARANLSAQIGEAAKLGHGRVQIWAL